MKYTLFLKAQGKTNVLHVLHSSLFKPWGETNAAHEIYIKFLKGEAETRKAIEAFQELSYFPQLVGAIDRSHVPIIAPKNDPNDYYNRKQFYSVVLQGVADARGHSYMWVLVVQGVSIMKEYYA